MRRRALVATAVLALVAGCGGDDEADRATSPEPATSETGTAPANTQQERQYAEGVQSALRTVSRVQEVTGRLGEDSSPQEVAAALGEIEELASTTADRLDALDAPTDVQELHADLVREHEALAAASASARDAAKDGDVEGVREYQAAGSRYRDRVTALGQQIGTRLDEP